MKTAVQISNKLPECQKKNPNRYQFKYTTAENMCGTFEEDPMKTIGGDAPEKVDRLTTDKSASENVCWQSV